jgi:hypothetical protein
MTRTPGSKENAGLARRFPYFWAVPAVLIVLAAACGPAATAVPPTSPPTGAPATDTAVPPTAAPTLVPPTPTAAPPTAEPTTDALPLLQAFQDAFNNGDADSLMLLFTEDPSFILNSGLFGVGAFGQPNVATEAAQAAVRNTFEIGFALNSELMANDCTFKNNQATCNLAIKDDCNPPTANPYHIRAQFVFEAGKIASVYGRWDSSEETAFSVYNAARQDWARQNLPDEAARYAAYNAPSSGETGPAGLAPGESASEYGEAVGRICTGYADAAP